MNGQVQVVDDVVSAFADLVVAEQPHRLFLSGGGTAEACYAELATRADALDWSGIDVFFGDERWVAVDQPDSNEGMTRRVLLDRLGADRVHSMVGAGPTVEAAAGAYDAVVAALPDLGLVHLGLGPDGHTASLFPGSPALAVVDRQIVATGDDLHPRRRLTLTFPAIARATLAVVTVAGADKAEAWARVQQGDGVPAARLRAPHLVWLVDAAANAVANG